MSWAANYGPSARSTTASPTTWPTITIASAACTSSLSLRTPVSWGRAGQIAATHASRSLSKKMWRRSTRADYAAEVDWDFDDRLAAVMMGATGRTPLTERSDIERYDTLSALAMRPKRHSVDDKTPEYARWFEYDGTPRLEPLTSEQLAEVLREDYGLPTPEATEQSHLHAIPTADWAWFREKRLGRMALPVTVLHELIRHEERVAEIDRQWAEQARSAGDFCVAMPASPLKVLAVIFDKLSRLGEGDPDLLARAQAAITHMQDPDNGLAVETDEYTAWLAEDWKHFSLRLSARDSELEPERETTDVSEPHPTEDFESPSM